MLYVYAISENPLLPGVNGLRDAPLQMIGETGNGGPFAIASEHPESPVDAGEADLWAHESVVEAAMEDGAVLPMRLGSSIAGSRELIHELRSRSGEFRRALARVRGAVELGVRASIDSGAVEGAAIEADGPLAGAAAGPGTAYMLGQLQRTRAAEEVAAIIHEPLDRLARDSRSRLEGNAPQCLAAAYLVDRAQLEPFRARVEELESEHALDIVCTGPWPPYSFVCAKEGP